MDVVSWVSGRVPGTVRHLDVAACGRVSTSVLDAQLAHLRAEVDGGYVAQDAAEEVLVPGRAALAGMVGLAGRDVAFLESAHEALWRLLEVWPLRPGARVGTVPSEYGPNALVLQRLAAQRGWELVGLPVDALGRVQGVPDALDLLVLPHVASQRGVVQPAAELVASGVPLVLDVAQALGQVEVPPGAAAYVGTSRKWLCGPRGVGFLVVDPEAEGGIADPPTAAPLVYTGARRLETTEAHVAGRVGLAVAAEEHVPGLLPVVRARAARLRAALADGPWTVVEPVDEPTGITTLLPPAGVDVAATRAALLDRGVLTSAVPATRAPDMTGPVLRLSTAAWVTDDDVDAAVESLRCTA